MSATGDLKTATKKLSNTGNFKYSSTLQKKYNSALADYNDYVNNASKYGYNAYITDVNDLFNQVMSQEQFSYDPQKDALFQMYKRQYTAQGNTAMKNQMGVAAAFSGGYNSSVAQTSAQQQYQNSMDELSEKAAQTYQNALSLYENKQQNLLDRYNTARDMSNSSNDAYWSQVNQKAQQVSNAYSAYNDDKQFQYNKWSDNRDYWSNRQQAAQTQVNWEKEYNQNNKWNNKNYNLNKKSYTGK